MLDEDEWSKVAPLLNKATQDVKTYRETTGASVEVAVRQGFDRLALARYLELTGFAETSVDELRRHRLADLCAPCEACGRPMRTEKASFCAECGHVSSNEALERSREG